MAKPIRNDDELPKNPLSAWSLGQFSGSPMTFLRWSWVSANAAGVKASAAHWVATRAELSNTRSIEHVHYPNLWALGRDVGRGCTVLLSTAASRNGFFARRIDYTSTLRENDRAKGAVDSLISRTDPWRFSSSSGNVLTQHHGIYSSASFWPRPQHVQGLMLL
jgi:hypothetical protein